MKAFKELTAEAKKKEMIRVKLKKGKKIGHVITSPGKGGKPGKVLKRKGMPGKKDVMGEAISSLKDIKNKFKKEWDAVRSGKVDIGDKKAEKFYSALFNYFADIGEMPLGTQKARTGDPHEWVHDRLMDESVVAMDEAKTMGGILKKVKMGTPPYTVVAMVKGKVVDQQSGIKVASQVPAIIKEFQGGGSGDTDLGSMHVGDVKIAVEDKDSRVVYSEQVEEGGMGRGDRNFNVKGGSIPSNDEIKAFYEKQKGSHSQKIAATKKHFGLQKMTVSAKGNVSAKGIREEEVETSNEGKESAAYKSNRAEYDKLMKKWGNTPITKIPWKEFARIRELGDSFYDTKAGSGLKVGDLLQHMKETYAPLSEELAYLQSKDGKQTFVVGPRDTRGMRGKQDKFSMYIVDTRTGKKIEDIGSHVSLKGAIKYALNRGFVKKQKGSTSEIKYNSSYADLAKSFKYDTLTGKRNESSGGGGHPRKALNFDERQKAYASAYRNVHKKAPSRDELRAAGVGKGFEKSFGDTSKGVKAWKAAMAKLKASEGRK